MPTISIESEKKEMDNVDSTDPVKHITNGVSENGISSTSPDKALDRNEWEVLLAQGKRNLFVKDYPNAVATLGDACAKMSEVFGDMADECADAYFCYGRALLELAREDSNVLSTEPEKEESDEEGGDEESEEKGGEENTKEKECEKGGELAKKKDEKEGSREAEAIKTELEENDHLDGQVDDKTKDEPRADETLDTTKDVIEDDGEGGDKGDDVDNLQLAWEVLELAKNIFERQKLDSKLAETYLYLGEVGLESENYSGAIEDMKRCVEIQKQILPSDHRDIAETHFQMGVACSLCNDFNQAIEHFKNSSEILETRIKNLQQNGASKAEIEKNPFYTVEKEIDEIKSLLPEITAKIIDMQDFKQETIKSMMATLKGETEAKSSDGAGPSSSVASIANGSDMKPVTDISHLVRKKRKPEEEIPEAGPVKKTCSTEANK